MLVSFTTIYMMHGTMKTKFINAKQAINVYDYENNKRKMYKINAALWYNKMCREPTKVQ